jgi:hypothetical protein
MWARPLLGLGVNMDIVNQHAGNIFSVERVSVLILMSYPQLGNVIVGRRVCIKTRILPMVAGPTTPLKCHSPPHISCI